MCTLPRSDNDVHLSARILTEQTRLGCCEPSILALLKSAPLLPRAGPPAIFCPAQQQSLASPRSTVGTCGLHHTCIPHARACVCVRACVRVRARARACVNACGHLYLLSLRQLFCQGPSLLRSRIHLRLQLFTSVCLLVRGKD